MRISRRRWWWWAGKPALATRATGLRNAAAIPKSRKLSGAASLRAAVTLPATVKPGVVTGPALKDLLDYAKERGFAMPGACVWVYACACACVGKRARDLLCVLDDAFRSLVGANSLTTVKILFSQWVPFFLWFPPITAHTGTPLSNVFKIKLHIHGSLSLARALSLSISLSLCFSLLSLSLSLSRIHTHTLRALCRCQHCRQQLNQLLPRGCARVWRTYDHHFLKGRRSGNIYICIFIYICICICIYMYMHNSTESARCYIYFVKWL